jgi:CBS domain-containing protein
MKVADVITKPPAYCSPQTNLAAAVEILWNHNCGVLPIVDTQEKVVAHSDSDFVAGSFGFLGGSLRS